MKRLWLLLFPILFTFNSIAQFADSGYGALRDRIWWFDWNGFTPANGATRTFTTTEGLTITLTYSNVTGAVLKPSVMNTWSGAVLHLLYNFKDQNIRPALFSENNSQNSHFNLNITATRNGQPTAFTFILADAEASSPDELTTVNTNGSPWRIQELFKNSNQTNNPVIGCGTQTATIADTYGNAPTTGLNPILATDAGITGTLALDLTLNKKVFGGMAIAMGIFAPVDRGDLPASYGNVQHALIYTNTNECNYNGPLPGLAQSQALRLGSVTPDADGQQTLNDNTPGADEDAITSFPTYSGNGTYQLTIPLTNTTGSNTFLSGWFDHNNDGVFTLNEKAIANISTGSASAQLTWTGIQSTLPAAQNFAFRFRLSSDKIAAENTSGYAPDGEVEDYLTSLNCTLLLTGKKDTTVCAGKQIQLNISGADNYSWFPTGGLSSSTVSNPVASPSQTTAYAVTGIKGSCKATDTVRITVITSPNFSVTPQSVTACTNDLVSFTATGGNNYQWISSNNAVVGNAATYSLNATQSNLYNVIITNDACQLSDTLQVALIVNSHPTVTVSKSNDVNCSLSTATLNATGGVDYKWTATNGITNLNSSSPIVRPQQTTVYAVTVKDANGCSASDSVTVNVNFTEGQSNYLMPDAFTPNGDGKNDCFGLKYNSGVTDFELVVYNRMGTVIFRTSDPSKCWDGRNKGVLLDAGTYVYQMKVSGTCNAGYKKGTVILIR